jgi:squalene synthase HpnC
MVSARPAAPALDAAYAQCQRLALGHYENFPVASLLIPRQMRHHVAAVYAFARSADDFADEGERLPDERCRLLDGWACRLRAAATSAGTGQPPMPGEPECTSEIFQALGATIRERDLPIELFEDLLSAFRQDVSVTRYETWEALLDYCRRSANPVGRLVLRIADRSDGQLDAWSDAICTALQLTNFWQDLMIDFRRGRLYLPAEERRAHGAREEDLALACVTAPWRSALSAAALRTRALFDAGRPLCGTMSGRLGYELRATWLGGVRILDRLERVGFDVVRHRPSLGLADAPWFAWRMATWAS